MQGDCFWGNSSDLMLKFFSDFLLIPEFCQDVKNFVPVHARSDDYFQISIGIMQISL